MAAPKGNINAEKWGLDTATEFMEQAEKLSRDKQYDFVGEVAKELNQYHNLFGYLVDKFPTLKTVRDKIYSNCETNCFYNGKKGDIVPSLAIMNLKSNHKWTDRNENTNEHKGEITITRKLVE
jgi:hypothetical protein